MARRATPGLKKVTFSAGRAGAGEAGNCGPSPERVAARAYEIYCQRCQSAQPGDAVSDWLAAEAELRAKA